MTATQFTGFFVSLAAALTCQGCPLSLGLTVPGTTEAPPAPVSPSSSQALTPKPDNKPDKPKPLTIKPETERFLRQRSRNITVKVMADQTWGSGVLIQRQGRRYLVLTNAHVSQAGKKLQIQTADGRLYPAKPFPQADFRGNDLALLEFESPNTYAIASLGRAADLKSGNMVFASGFPLQPQGGDQDGFVFTQGQVSLVNPKSFEGGYQIGYFNPVVKGMSGGPVLNSNGVLVAVNGMHAYPLWGNPYVFADGTTPPASQQNLLTRSSWGIPVETFLTLAPKSLELTRPQSIQPAATAPVVIPPLGPARAPQPRPTLPASIR